MHAYRLNGKVIYTEGQPEIKIKLVKHLKAQLAFMQKKKNKKQPSLKIGKENCEIIVLRNIIFIFEKIKKRNSILIFFTNDIYVQIFPS